MSRCTVRGLGLGAARGQSPLIYDIIVVPSFKSEVIALEKALAPKNHTVLIDSQLRKPRLISSWPLSFS